MTETPDPVGRHAHLQHLTDDHLRALEFHPLTPGRGEIHERLRAAAMVFADVIDELCPFSRESSLAFTAVQDSLMWANAAVAIHTPEPEPGDG